MNNIEQTIIQAHEKGLLNSHHTGNSIIDKASRILRIIQRESFCGMEQKQIEDLTGGEDVREYLYALIELGIIAVENKMYIMQHWINLRQYSCMN